MPGPPLPGPALRGPTLPARLFAPAKLTLGLRVTGVRDDGYHLIDAEMVALDLGDDLWLEEGQGFEVRTEAGDPVDVGDVGSNLVTRALALVGRRARVSVVKRIPPGAGLGGGSADAAAVLRWAGWGVRPEARTPELSAAANLGADVAFCLLGGRARVTGIGELVAPLPVEARTLTVVTPSFGCSTPAVYREWDRLGGPTGDHGNDLESAALSVEPRLAEWRDRIGAATGARPRLAGSGSSWFLEGDHAAALEGVPGAHVVRTVPEGYRPPP